MGWRRNQQRGYLRHLDSAVTISIASSDDFRDSRETVEKVMIPVSRIFSIRVHSTLQELGPFSVSFLNFDLRYNAEALVEAHPYHGFPVVDGGLLIGYVIRARLREAIGSRDSPSQYSISHSPFT